MSLDQAKSWTKVILPSLGDWTYLDRQMHWPLSQRSARWTVHSFHQIMKQLFVSKLSTVWAACVKVVSESTLVYGKHSILKCLLLYLTKSLCQWLKCCAQQPLTSLEGALHLASPTGCLCLLENAMRIPDAFKDMFNSEWHLSGGHDLVLVGFIEWPMQAVCHLVNILPLSLRFKWQMPFFHSKSSYGVYP